MADIERIPLDKKMSDRITKARAAKRLTQKALADKAKVPRARIKRLEGLEMHTIDRSEYVRITRALGISALGISALYPTKKVKGIKKKPVITGGKAQLTKKQVLFRLQNAGLADMTLREFLSL